MFIRVASGHKMLLLQDLAREYQITAMPTILFLKDGKPVAQVVGANLALIEKNLEEHGKVPVAA